MSIPEVDPLTGFHPTLNAMGGMSPVMDAFTESFVEFCDKVEYPVLDVGAAYGLASLAAAAKGATVWANDLEPRHLEIIREKAPKEASVRFIKGRFPEDIPWSDGPIGAALLARMIHFLDGDELQRGFNLLHEHLQPGGKVFGISVTPFLKKLVPFRPIYEERKAAGDRWPGLVRVADWDPEGAPGLPPTLHALDHEVLGRALTDAGFEIEKLEYFSRQEFTKDMKCDGREAIGFIALKGDTP